MESIAHDHQLRALLKSHLSTRVGDDDLLVDEFSLAYGTVRADLALVNGHLEGFEIKAGKDTLERLLNQVESYGKVFEYSWVVTTEGHLRAARALVPKHWGLLVAVADFDGSRLRQVRKAQRNRGLEAEHLARLLWRDEVMVKLEELGLSTGLRSKPKVALFAELAKALPVQDLAAYVRGCLKARKDWRVDAGPHGYGGSLRRAAR
ncbi:sce7726 family protein [Methylibium sp. Root1272]|jgi:hypothetical protein|uniref:sce7726 family protein n=1 Tax=Methylibium sp. Root1272 TaxID=1736441 RepID=UPI00138EF8D1|nr:sce7726 family protein [Methylibium sp. Root1272]